MIGATGATFTATSKSSGANYLDTEVPLRAAAAEMRRNPRFMPMAAEFGPVAVWERTTHWPEFCEAKDRPYDCRAVAAKHHG